MLEDLVSFPLLNLPYSCTTFEYSAEKLQGSPSLHDWLRVCASSIPTFKKHASADDTVEIEDRMEAVKQFEAEFIQILTRLQEHPSADIPGYKAQPVNCLSLCRVRDQCLHNAGFLDIFRAVKEQENMQALNVLPSVLQELDQIQDMHERWNLCLRGVFAGNIFDLGAVASAELFNKNGAANSFSETRQKLLPRPWAVDDLDAILLRICGDIRSNLQCGAEGSSVQDSSNGLPVTSSVYNKVLLFVDNAGSDLVLGMLPLAREFIKLGTEVALVANRGPTINDITYRELLPLVQEAAGRDSVLREALDSSRLKVVCSGSDLPVIDLSVVSKELAAECEGVDLVVLEGMGRAIETNLHAKFTCDSWKLGMIKHPEVATCLNGRMYDCVCKYDVVIP
ncbi:hypothetical protein CEUSTIGMA_g2462.t1 [Chlamydomonas eustigma]|uniref:Damage-control phosphatase ARMT1-like metal-binding domain-containing protein n=1 Tax=Chlamydomonas eustigma TaxID=1157962 RepID=A0A250WW73_9CHLO|nr:hypothetical protein CEUSTIGMA_g2462.t1 [Chlamydomonas eustigma]|eukprot:GAX75016.1 hypothetical protein CEUSTIGMA_g2462.t1 [Chlamydomonas eustigma]